LGQFQRFPKFKLSPGSGSDPTCPVQYVSWHQAAAYCNWISGQEGLPECYELDDKGFVTGPKKDFDQSAGYRLPHEWEFEHAARAGAVTSRCFGETEELLPHYAWYNKNSKNSIWPVGQLMPNDFGLFDAHGNVYCWCQELYVGVQKENPVAGKSIM